LSPAHTIPRRTEQKLFNVAKDIREQKNLVHEDPTMALALKTAMSRYLESIDAEDIQEVYKARFAELNRFEAMARSVHAKAIEQAKGGLSRIAEANERLEKDLARFEQNRQECRENMQGKTF
jgi:gamma-glutamyl:cysteine ligase YbdK (ATP-grasp superfamily)